MTNPYIHSLIADIRARYSIETSGMTTSEWLETNTFFKGRPFSFNNYRFQRAIADDLHPNLDVIKISQVGLTEIQMRKALSILVRNPATNGIFSLPNEKMYRRFAQTRLTPLVAENRVFQLQTTTEPVRSMELVQIGTSFLHVANATEASATSISADFVFTDEVDLSDQKVVALFASRLQNSTMRIRQGFSTPTWTGFGIDGAFASSDQREYVARCEGCNHWQVPLWDRRWVRIPGLSTDMLLTDVTDSDAQKLDLEAAQVVCEKCDRPLDLDSPERTWVASFPTRTHARGYRVRPFSAGRLSISYILSRMLEYQRRDYIRGWYNTVLGEPYTDANARLDESAIRSCMDTPGMVPVPPTDPVFLGVDIGQVCHLTLGKFVGDVMMVFLFRVVRVDDLLSTVRELRQTYNIVGGACDRHPYTPTANDLRDSTGGVILPVEYRGEKELYPVRTIEEKITHWQAKRTPALDDVATRVRTGRIKFYGYGDQSGVLITHLRDMVRDEKPENPATWHKLSGNDHYFHALAFLLLGAKIKGIHFQTNLETRSVISLGGFNFRLG